MEQIVALLAMGEPLPDKNRSHALSGDWAGHRECHILRVYEEKSVIKIFYDNDWG